MFKFKKNQLETLFQQFNKKTIMVIGDMILDQYIWGNVSRISPEAPIPVVDIESESFRFGGAANVAINVKSLGAEVLPIGIIGDDNYGEKIKELLNKDGITIDGLVIDNNRCTTLKTRIIAHNQHVVRIDREEKSEITVKIKNKILNLYNKYLDKVDGIILEDYNKGLFITSLIKEIIRLANEKKKMIFVDPKFEYFFDYCNVTLFKPNRKEVADRLGIKLDSEESIVNAGEILLDKLQCKYILITLGEEGLIIYESGKKWLKIPTYSVKVHDVSGAGDTMIAALSVAMTSEASFEEAAIIGNHAAGIVCSEVGIVPVNRTQLYEKLLKYQI
jgi:rfaE bifunctional protein kinase chain/domain